MKLSHKYKFDIHQLLGHAPYIIFFEGPEPESADALTEYTVRRLNRQYLRDNGKIVNVYRKIRVENMVIAQGKLWKSGGDTYDCVLKIERTGIITFYRTYDHIGNVVFQNKFEGCGTAVHHDTLDFRLDISIEGVQSK